uniref:Uncharacterized protein n=1 Tax=Lactuca sativa TaxID=4236 RepID=A0A9R1UYC0_LACSA|nr:hypothetical protein LSAT_V11C700371770 [Lactuca sativa]
MSLQSPAKESQFPDSKRDQKLPTKLPQIESTSQNPETTQHNSRGPLARAFFSRTCPDYALLYCSFSLQLPFLSFSLRQTLSLLLGSRRRQLLPPPTFLLVLAPPTSDLRLAPPHRPTLSSVTQPMEPLISGNLTSPALASNIRSGDLDQENSEPSEEWWHYSNPSDGRKLSITATESRRLEWEKDK